MITPHRLGRVCSHLAASMKTLNDNDTVQVKMDSGITVDFTASKVVSQRYILSPLLCNIYEERSMIIEVSWQGRSSVGEKRFQNLRFAIIPTPLANNEEEFTELLKQVGRESLTLRLEASRSKTLQHQLLLLEE